MFAILKKGAYTHTYMHAHTELGPVGPAPAGGGKAALPTEPPAGFLCPLASRSACSVPPARSLDAPPKAQPFRALPGWQRSTSSSQALAPRWAEAGPVGASEGYAEAALGTRAWCLPGPPPWGVTLVDAASWSGDPGVSATSCAQGWEWRESTLWAGS